MPRGRVSRRWQVLPPDAGDCPERARKSNTTLLKAFSTSQPAIARKATTKKRRKEDTIIEKEVESAAEDIGDVQAPAIECLILCGSLLMIWPV